MKDWRVYILRCRDGTLYTGIAVDLGKRLEAHGKGVAAKYTRSRRPVVLVYQESQPDRSSAQRREAALRRLGRAGKLALIASLRPRTDRLERIDAGFTCEPADSAPRARPPRGSHRRPSRADRRR